MFDYENLPEEIGPLYPAYQFPFLGETVPNLTQEEYDNLELKYFYKSRSFDLAKSDDKTEFETVMSEIYNAKYKLINKENRWKDNSVTPCVWLEWVEIYTVLESKTK